MANLKQKILQQLKAKGYKLTPKRLLMVDLLLTAAEPLTVVELYEQVRLTYPDVSLDTVYRTLNTLIATGIVDSIAGIGKQGCKYEITYNHHHHLICVKCGQTLCLDYCPINREFEEMVQNQGYALLRHDLELYGICASCRQKK